MKSNGDPAVLPGEPEKIVFETAPDAFGTIRPHPYPVPILDLPFAATF